MADLLTDEEMKKLESEPSSEVISDEQMAGMEAEAKEYDSPILAGALGTARGLTLGGSDWLAKGFGFADEVSKLKEYNPSASVGGEIVGALAPAIATMGGSAVAQGTVRGSVAAASRFAPSALAQRAGVAATQATAKKIAQKYGEQAAKNWIGKAASVAAGGAIEGAIYGAGQGISELALTKEKITPQSAAETMISSAGLGLVVGGLTSGAISAAGSGLSATGRKVSEFWKGPKKAPPGPSYSFTQTVGETQGTLQGQIDLKGRTTFEPVTGTIRDADDLVTKTVRANRPEASSIDDLIKLNEEAKLTGEADDILGLKRFDEINERLAPELKNRPTNIHREMQASPMKRDVIKTDLTVVPGPAREAFDAHNLRMDREADDLLEGALSKMGDRKRLGIVESGEDLVNTVGQKYKAAKDEAGKLFKVIHKTRVPTKAHIADLVDTIAGDAPQVGNALEVAEDGLLKLKPFSTTLGIGEGEYKIISKVVNDLNAPELTVREMQNMREFLRASVDPANPAATPNIGRIRKAMLGHVEKLVEAYNPEARVREAFTSYAKNEAMIESFETIIGGKIDTLNALYRQSPEKVLGRIFSNGKNAQVAREFLGEERFNAYLGDYLKNIVESATDTASGKVSGARLARVIKQKKPILSQLGQDEVIQRLEDIADFKRIVTQVAPVNPSGTAKTGIIAGSLRGVKQFINFQPGDALTQFAGGLDQHIRAKSALNSVNAVLKGAEVVADAQRETVGFVAKTLNAFKKGAEAVEAAGPGVRRVTVPSAVIGVADLSAQKQMIQKLAEYEGNPEALVDEVSKNTEGAAQTDPEIAEELTATATRAVQFLQSKAPKNPHVGSMFKAKGAKEWKPSDQETMKFNRYVRAVDRPLSILDDFQNRILTPESVEAVRTVYPDLYERIKTQAIDVFADGSTEFNYADRVQISILLEMPVENSLSPDFIKKIQDVHRSPGGDEDGAKPNMPGMRQMDPAGRSLTPMQKVEQR